MKKKYLCIVLITLICCNSKKDAYLISENSVGLLKIGMNINDANKLFSDCKIEKVDLSIFGLDGGGSGILIKRQNEKIVVFWTNSDKNKVDGILCFSSKYHTKHGIKPKMTIGELKKILPKSTIQVNLIFPEHEFIILESEHVNLDFLSTEGNRIGKYKNIDPDESTTEMKLNARVNYIELIVK